MTTVAGLNATDNVSVEARGRLLFEARQYWIEGDTGHVCEDDRVYLVPILETGPACYCVEFMQWGTCPHAECILNATGDAEPVNMD